MARGRAESDCAPPSSSSATTAGSCKICRAARSGSTAAAPARFDRGFAEFEAWRDRELEEEERQQHKMDRKIVAEEHWLRYGVTARRKRNQKRLAGLADDARRAPRRAPAGRARSGSSPRRRKVSGKLVIEAEAIEKSFGERVIVKDFSARILRGDRLGIIGANGAGKTTLISLLTGALAPGRRARSGSAPVSKWRRSTRAAPASIRRRVLKDALTGGGSDFVEINGERKHVIGYMKDFLFGPEQARTPIGKLSGGERGRLMLARALARPSNLLVLDEPTNDLDLETLDLLQEMLCDYKGTLLIVSHDRDFLDRVTTSVLMSGGDGRWVEYAGGYSDMVAQRGAGVSAISAPLSNARPSLNRSGTRAKAKAAPQLQGEA